MVTRGCASIDSEDRDVISYVKDRERYRGERSLSVSDIAGNKNKKKSSGLHQEN